MTTSAIGTVRGGECHVWFAEACSDLNLLDLLDDTERERYRHTVVESARALYLTAHALARRVIAAQLGTSPAELRFTASCGRCGKAHGKPVLVGSPLPLELSLSHSGRRVAVALALGTEIGVDIERVAESYDEHLPSTVLAASERQALARLPEPDRTAGFTRYWCRKEAVLKATGHGLLVDPALLTVSPPDAPPRLEHWRDRPGPPVPPHLTDLHPGPGYRAALAALGAAPRVIEHHEADLMAALG
ncbi:4'-phosphopantetheinyl transferase family protein [Streptomyces sp. LZ34]